MTGADDEQHVDELALAGTLIEQLERSRTTSAGVLRKRTYQLLGALGIDVPQLVGEARETLKRELRRKAKHATRRRELIEQRLQREKLDPETEERARLALKTAPKTIAAHKRALQDVMNRPAVQPMDPTLQRHRHTPEAVDSVLVSSPGERWTLTKRFNWPVDHIAEVLSAAEYEAAERYFWAYVNREGRPKVNNYGDGGSVGDPTKKLGLTSNQEKAGREWEMWRRRIPPALKPVLDNFVLEQPPRGSSRPLSRAEWGKLYCRCQHDHQARGVADGALKLACGVLAAIWAEYQDWWETQRAHIKSAAQNAHIRAMIAAGALDQAARAIHAETREKEAARARGVNAQLARQWLDGQEMRSSVSQVSIEVIRRSS